MKRKSIITALLALTVSAFIVGQTFAFVIPASIEELTEKSELVVIGVVESVRSSRGKKSKMIYSIAAVTVTEVLKGSSDGGGILVEFRGGFLPEENRGLGLSTVDPLEKGEKVLLFLYAKESNVLDGNTYHIAQFSRGKYTIDDEGRIKKDMYSMEGEKKTTFRNPSIETIKEQIRRAQ
jgi:hypothetical protein